MYLLWISNKLLLY